MMKKTWIKIMDICQSTQIEISFVRELHHHGLIEIITDANIEFLDEEHLSRIEQYSSWYYDLEINMQGLEVVRNLLDKIEDLQEEIRLLKG